MDPRLMLDEESEIHSVNSNLLPAANLKKKKLG